LKYHGQVRPGPGRSKLFHAIVVAGAGMLGGCSTGPLVAGDAGPGAPVDAPYDMATGGDTSGGDGPGLDGGIVIDAGATDGSNPGSCHCRTDAGGDFCGPCACGCPTQLEAGVCFPCYI
jgi:hypothetical protein